MPEVCVGKIPIRPIIVVEAYPKEVEKNQMLQISCRIFDKNTLTLYQEQSQKNIEKYSFKTFEDTIQKPLLNQKTETIEEMKGNISKIESDIKTEASHNLDPSVMPVETDFG